MPGADGGSMGSEKLLALRSRQTCHKGVDKYIHLCVVCTLGSLHNFLHSGRPRTSYRSLFLFEKFVSIL